MRFAHYKKHIIPFRDDIWYFHSIGQSKLPLVIEWAGYSQWGQDHFYARQACDIFVIEQITMGNARFIQDGREYVVNPGEIFILRPGPDHWYSPSSAGFLHKRLARIDGPMLDPLLRITGLWERDIVVPRDPGEIIGLLRKAGSLLRKKEPGWAEKSSLLAYEIIMAVSKSIGAKTPALLDKALTYIERNLPNPLTNRDISSETGLSRTHFNRLFKAHIGMAPIQYLIAERIKWAKRLLTTTSLSVKQVALTVGYENQLYFSSLFKRRIGASPKAYRDSARKEIEKGSYPQA
jgi:AraC-like DNA-binding protein